VKRRLGGGCEIAPTWELVRWKGAAIQMGLEPGSGGITIVRRRYQAVIAKTLQAGRDLVCVCNSDL
jgi:hypothetical protein